MRQKYNYLHIIDGEIKKCKYIHPYNDRNVNNLSDKTCFMKSFMNDISGSDNAVLNGDDDFEFTDISENKKSLFNFKLNGEFYNTFIEHPDGGGRDVSLNQTSKKVSIPYGNSSFRRLIKDMKNVLVLDIYYELKEINGKLEPNLDKYCYLIVIPSEIYTSEVVYNILYDVKKSSPSSRWVKLENIKKCIDTNLTGINENGNVWIVHPNNLQNFLMSIVIDDYKNQFQRAYIKLLEIAYGNKKLSKREKEILRVRKKLRIKLIEKIDKCEISNCGIHDKVCLVASHIWPVNKILSNQDLKWKNKIKYIGDSNNAFLFCNLHDKLFDRFLISFDSDGKVIVSKLLKHSICSYNLIANKKYLNITKEHDFYLEKHREIFNEFESGRCV